MRAARRSPRGSIIGAGSPIAAASRVGRRLLPPHVCPAKGPITSGCEIRRGSGQEARALPSVYWAENRDREEPPTPW
jgi:hypothetical protein